MLIRKGFQNACFSCEGMVLARVYPKTVVSNQIHEVVFSSDHSVKKNLKSGIPFVTTYHPKVKELGKLIRELLILKFKRFFHLLRSHLTQMRDKQKII